MSIRAELIRFALRRLFKDSEDHKPDIAAIRSGLDRVERFVPNPPRGTITTRLTAGAVPAIRVTRPGSKPNRAILYLHGGGYCYGSPSLYRDFIWRIAAVSQASVLCPVYRLAPEHPFPAAIDDAARVYRWMLAQGIEPQRLAIMGDSAGGGLAFATLLKLRDEHTPLPAAAVALSPWTDLTLTSATTASHVNADPMLSVNPARRLAEWYLGGADARTPYASPLHGDLRELPPSLIQVGSDEILHDDAVHMAARMRTAGVAAEVEVWPRMPHVWQLYARILPEARRAIEQIGRFLRMRMDGPTVGSKDTATTQRRQ